MSRDEIAEGVLPRLPFALRARLHKRVDLLDLPLANQVADRVVGNQNLERRHSSLLVYRLHKSLCHHALERESELHADLILLLAGEYVDDAVDRARCALRVQRGEDQVAGLSRGQRDTAPILVASLADDDQTG